MTSEDAFKSVWFFGDLIMAKNYVYFDKFCKLTKYHFLAIGLWPYQANKYDKFLRYLWAFQNIVAISLLVSIQFYGGN